MELSQNIHIFNDTDLFDFLFCQMNNKEYPVKTIYDKYLLNNNNKERKKYKRTCILVEKYLKSTREYKEKSKENIDLTRNLLKLLSTNCYLGSRRGSLMMSKSYFISKQGSIFWANLVKRVLKKIHFELNYKKYYNIK